MISVMLVPLCNIHIAGGTPLTITGTGFGGSASNDDSITVGEVTASIVSYSNDKIEVKLPALKPGSYPVVIQVEDLGWADAR